MAFVCIAGCSVTTETEELANADESSQESTAASPGQPAPPPPSRPRLRLGLTHEPLTLDPAEAVDHESILVCENLFDTLVRYKTGSMEIEPALAESYQHTKDQLTWLFTLRKRVTFHDGTPVTADAVAFSFQRQMDREHPFKPKNNVFWSRIMTAIREIRVLDSRRLAIELNRPYAPLLANLAMPQAAIVSPAAVKSRQGDFSRAPVGSGPFRFVERSGSRTLVLTSNDDYWEGAPKISGVDIRAVRDPSARLLQLVSNELDAMEGIAPADLKVAEKKRLRVQMEPSLNVVYLAFNTVEPPRVIPKEGPWQYGDKMTTYGRWAITSARFRRALSRAIDREALVKDVYDGMAIPAKDLLPPTLWGHTEKETDDSDEFGHDPVEAQIELELAGYQPGLLVELCTLDASRSYMPRPRLLAHRIRRDLERIGLNVVVQVMDFEEYTEVTQNGKHQMALLGWTGDNGDPDNFLFTLLDSDSIRHGDSSNISFYNSPDLHRLLLEAQGSSQPLSRQKLYGLATDHIQKRAPVIPLVHTLDSLVTTNRVKGLKLHPVGFRRLRQVEVQN